MILSKKKRSVRKVSTEVCSGSPAIVKVTLVFTTVLSLVHFCVVRAASILTYLPGHCSRFPSLVHEKVVQICSKHFIPQALTECAQLASSIHICILLPGSFSQGWKGSESQAGWKSWKISANQPMTNRSGMLIPQLASPSRGIMEDYELHCFPTVL